MTPTDLAEFFKIAKGGRTFKWLAREMGVSKNQAENWCNIHGLTKAAEVMTAMENLGFTVTVKKRKSYVLPEEDRLIEHRMF